MKIKIKNKKLLFDNYKVKCSIGKRGICKKKKEGDNTTPKGTYKFISLYYRKDRIKKIKSKIKKNIIRKNMGWCDDPKSKDYNKLIKFPYDFTAEKLYLKESIYDYILVLDYNTKSTKRGMGSAIFLHIAKRNYKSTRGCIAISKKHMKILLDKINKNTKITI